MTLSNETLMAFVDGELSPAEMTRIEAELLKEPALAEYVEQQRELRDKLHASLDAVMNAPFPPELMEALENTPVSWQWYFQRVVQVLKTRRGMILAGIPAAALACGVIIGVVLSGNAANTLMDVRGNALIASGNLARALDRQLASAQSPNDAAQIGISFRDKNNQYCRTFSTSDVAGVACKSAGGWNIAALAQHGKEAAGAYATAGSAMPDLVRDAVQGMIAGAPLDAASERQARQSGWKNR